MTSFYALLRSKIVVACFLLFAVQTVSAQVVSHTATGNVETTVLEQVLTMESVKNLSFGSIFPISTAETVTLSSTSLDPNATPNITRSNTNLLVLETPTAGVWDINGVPGALVSITIPEDNTVFIQESSGESMAVNSFNMRSNAGTSQNLTLQGAGTARFALFATLSVGSNQKAGAYTGTYQVTVNYQ